MGFPWLGSLCCCGGGGTPTFDCSRCAIPKKNLTLTILGIGSFAVWSGTSTLVYLAGPTNWETATRLIGIVTRYWDFGCFGSGTPTVNIRCYGKVGGGSYVLNFSSATGDSPNQGTMIRDSLTCGQSFIGVWHFTANPGNSMTWTVSA